MILAITRDEKWLTIQELSDKEKKYLRILNYSYHNLPIITYQQLLEKAKNTLKITENN